MLDFVDFWSESSDDLELFDDLDDVIIGEDEMSDNESLYDGFETGVPKDEDFVVELFLFEDEERNSELEEILNELDLLDLLEWCEDLVEIDDLNETGVEFAKLDDKLNVESETFCFADE